MVKAQKNRVETSFAAERKGLFAFVRSRIDSMEEAEDLVQEVFFQALSNLNVLEAVDNLTGWLYTVAKNKIIDWYRKKRLDTVSLNEPAESGLDFRDVLASEISDQFNADDQQIFADAIMESIGELLEKQKYVFIRQVIEGRTFRELSEETGDSINTLIARKRSAIQFLQKRLKQMKQLLAES